MVSVADQAGAKRCPTAVARHAENLRGVGFAELSFEPGSAAPSNGGSGLGSSGCFGRHRDTGALPRRAFETQGPLRRQIFGHGSDGSHHSVLGIFQRLDALASFPKHDIDCPQRLLRFAEEAEGHVVSSANRAIDAFELEVFCPDLCQHRYKRPSHQSSSQQVFLGPQLCRRDVKLRPSNRNSHRARSACRHAVLTCRSLKPVNDFSIEAAFCSVGHVFQVSSELRRHAQGVRLLLFRFHPPIIDSF